MYSKLASAIINDVYSGLAGLHHNISMSQEQLEDEIIAMRLQVIKEYQLKGILPLKDLLLSINCIPVDCKDLERCPICKPGTKTPNAHFEIPQIMTEFGDNSIAYLGTVDRQRAFTTYITPDFTNNYQQYRKRGQQTPYVYIDPTPNENNMYDGYIFNAPLLKMISIVALFKDPRQLEGYGCCDTLFEEGKENYTFIDTEVKNRLTNLKIKYYRQLHMPNLPNDQQYV